jgi:hypothetical protein
MLKLSIFDILSKDIQRFLKYLYSSSFCIPSEFLSLCSFFVPLEVVPNKDFSSWSICPSLAILCLVFPVDKLNGGRARNGDVALQ